jgi:hypothetical protein
LKSILLLIDFEFYLDFECNVLMTTKKDIFNNNKTLKDCALKESKIFKINALLIGLYNERYI